ncbi:protein of unknown function [Vibrio tapetis subsp. tapetis]|uniref:Uncharacterized protein n=1 Tax=Vibrio tapetis subsp. tapetis TaxID=1671868 RepID=A0A2N8ZAK0_9VIBR|nr:protein of unknown function [Vibrio tapetis subsp. tapetis]
MSRLDLILENFYSLNVFEHSNGNAFPQKRSESQTQNEIAIVITLNCSLISK